MITKKKNNDAEEYIIDTAKVRKTALYELLKTAIVAFKDFPDPNKITFYDMFNHMYYLAFSDEKKRFEVHRIACDEDLKEKLSIVDISTKEKITYNAFAKHGDVCPKLRGLIDAINGDSSFPHYAVVLDNIIYIDNEEAGFEYSDRLTSKASNLVLRIAELSKKCPYKMKIEEEGAPVAKSENEA